MDYGSLLELVKTRRSIREIKPDPIPDEYVDKVIEVARWAPSGFNMQPWEFVVVKEPELKDSIVQIVDEYRTTDFFKMEATRESWQGSPWVPRDVNEFRLSKAPVYILLLGDTRTNVGLPMPVRYTKEKLESIWESTLANAFLYMHLAATTLGLGSHWVSAVKIPLVQCLIKDRLGLPNEMKIYEMMGLGYPASPPGPKLMRNKGKMIHYDYCGKDAFRTDEEVKESIIKFRAGNVERHGGKGD